MRPIMMCFALLLAACSAGGKPDDVTARYVREAPSGPVIVKAAANGDARVEAGDTVFLRRLGVDYVVRRDSAGTYSVRRDDLLAVLAEGDGPPPGPRAQPEYATTPGAAETVASVKGTVWRVHPRDIPSLTSVEAVIADNPAFANLGKALAMQTRFAIERNSALQGGPGNFEKATAALFDKGAVLRLGSALRLDRLERKPIPISEFEVPRPLLDRAALKARIEAAELDEMKASAR
jgi:hypothetical protein